MDCCVIKSRRENRGGMIYEGIGLRNVVGEGTFGLLFAGLAVSGMIYHSWYILNGAIDINSHLLLIPSL